MSHAYESARARHCSHFYWSTFGIVVVIPLVPCRFQARDTGNWMSKMQSFTFASKFCSAMSSISSTCPHQSRLLLIGHCYVPDAKAPSNRSFASRIETLKCDDIWKLSFELLKFIRAPHLPLALIPFVSLFNNRAPSLVSIFIFALKLLAQKFVARTNLNDGKAAGLLLLLCVWVVSVKTAN